MSARERRLERQRLRDEKLKAEEETGKSVGRDAKAGKATFVTILGAERARSQAKLLSEQAIRHLSVFDGRAKHLEDVARFVVDRKS